MTSPDVGPNALLSDVVADRIRQLRRRRGWSVQDLASRTRSSELTDQAIYNIENGRRDKTGRRRRLVTVDELMDFAAAFAVTPGWLVMPDPADTDEVALVPGVALPWWAAAEWITANELPGELTPDDGEPLFRESIGSFQAIHNYILMFRDILHCLTKLQEAIAAEVRGRGASDEDRLRHDVFTWSLTIETGLPEFHELLTKLVKEHRIVPPALPRRLAEALDDEGLDLPPGVKVRGRQRPRSDRLADQEG